MTEPKQLLISIGFLSTFSLFTGVAKIISGNVLVGSVISTFALLGVILAFVLKNTKYMTIFHTNIKLIFPKKHAELVTKNNDIPNEFKYKKNNQSNLQFIIGCLSIVIPLSCAFIGRFLWDCFDKSYMNGFLVVIIIIGGALLGIIFSLISFFTPKGKLKILSIIGAIISTVILLPYLLTFLG